MEIFKSNYNDLLSYFEQHKEKNFNDWLNYESTLKKLGKQGIVGFLNPTINKDQKIFFKYSQYNDNLIQHESTILEGLNEISNFCPHFCKSFGTIKCKINPENKINPFDLETLNANSYFKHPYFGDLNLKKTLWFLNLHTNHHLKIIKDIADNV